MNENMEYYKSESLRLCERLLSELQENAEDAYQFFGGEIYKSYAEATDTAMDKTKYIQNKIRNL